VADTGVFAGRIGYYAMIWDGRASNASLTPDDPAFWNGAEHVKIAGIGTNSITVQRGYDPSTGSFSASLASQHPRDSRIAFHVSGAFTGPGTWSFNQSTTSPRDPNRLQFNQVMANWLTEHLQDVYKPDTRTYRAYPGAWDGVLFDSTGYWLSEQEPLTDVNNDLVPDGGILTPGRSAWGEGLDRMFSLTRLGLGPDILLVGGSIPTRGAAYLNGTELEGFPGSSHSSNNWKVYSGALSLYHVWEAEAGATPAHTELYARIGTDQYPSCVQFGQHTAQGHDSDFRFLLGTALLSDGYLSYNNGCYGDYWWDEYSVDLATGEAVSRSADVDSLAAHMGYLGQPLGSAQRLLNPTNGANLMSGGSWDVKTRNNGAGVLTVNGTTVSIQVTSPGTQTNDVALRYSPVSLVGGQEYTLSFLARADNPRMAVDLVRDVGVTFGSPGGAVSLGAVSVTGEWQRYWVDFVAPATTTKASLLLRIGRDSGTVRFDQVGVYQGGSDLFRRDFTNGIVVVNGTWQTQTVSLGGTYRKIRGTQNPGFNDGSTVSSVTLSPHDAIILLRRP
jgi:hypothetical protein